MRPVVAIAALVAATALPPECNLAGQGIPISHRDRVYAAEQFSNTVSVIDPSTKKLLGVIRSEEHTSELQSLAYLVCRLLLEKKKKKSKKTIHDVTETRLRITLKQ